MDEKQRFNANKLIEIAKRDLTEMSTLFQNQLYFGTVNRAYYAMFHAVSALLMTDGKRYRKHSAVISAFGRDYANIGLAPREYHEILNNAFDIRERADYDVDVDINHAMAERYCQKAEELVAKRLAEDK